MKENEQPIKVIRYSWKRSALLGAIFLLLTVASYVPLFNQDKNIKSGEVVTLILFPALLIYFIRKVMDRNPVYILFIDRIVMAREDNKALLFSNFNYYELDRMRYRGNNAFMPRYINLYDERNNFRFRMRIDNTDIEEEWLLSFLDERLEKYDFLKSTYKNK